MSEQETQDISLALSGGGIRAMVFHLGVLKCMSELRLLERVARISTVSGGSLVTGLVYQECGLVWPSSEQFLSAVYPALRERLCARSLQWGALRQLCNPWNLRFALSRANLLAQALSAEWGIDCHLSDLPAVPEWSINGTTAENGKRFRFKRHDFGDYELGYASAAGFPLASALAVSAAFPGGFGPLALNAANHKWRKRPWDAPPGSEQYVTPKHARLHLYDGGVYDNLGLEPFFDSGKQKSKQRDDCIIVSDAGSPLPKGFSLGPLNPFRLKRVADIMSDQARALRVRAFANYVQGGGHRGAFLYISQPVTAAADCPNAEYAALFPTTLRRLRAVEFDRLAAHGYDVARTVERLYGLGGAPAAPKGSSRAELST
ncbi:patatin-like phospholipase family protein [Aromatoleum toluclasticum]|uniref:patatin-like phospholipase family protein n=1 Tax=Aromatoleum toluclasticum TaxID=92003 RepID=UPI00036C0248|nr:patatin-like phospholipase family protein [Aromatoleum toluclasticum]